MKVNTRVRYGLRAILQIADNYGGDPVPISTIYSRLHTARRRFSDAYSKIVDRSEEKSIARASGMR